LTYILVLVLEAWTILESKPGSRL